MVYSAHGEAGQTFGVFVEHFEVFDLCVSRPALHEGEHLLDSFVFALEHCFHRSVGAVLHPAGDTRRLRFLPRRVTEEDSLDPPACDNSLTDQDRVRSMPGTRTRCWPP